MNSIPVATVPIPLAPVKKKAQAIGKAELQREFRAMSEAMVQEKGLLKHVQAALLLEVSTRRVGELVELGKLNRFDFLGRTYVSMREVFTLVTKLRTWQRRICAGKLSFVVRGGTALSQCGGA